MLGYAYCFWQLLSLGWGLRASLGLLTCAHVPQAVSIDEVPAFIGVIAQHVLELGCNLALHWLLGYEITDGSSRVLQVNADSGLLQRIAIEYTFQGEALKQIEEVLQNGPAYVQVQQECGPSRCKLGYMKD